MIYYDYTITVKGDKASLDKNIYLYRKNRKIDYYFKIIDASFVFKETDLTQKATKSTIKIINPSGKKIITKDIFIGLDNKIHFRIQGDLIDGIDEVGSYTFQIDLYDDDNGRVTIPPIEGQLIVLEPLFDDDDYDENDYDADSGMTRVGIAQVNINRITVLGEDITLEWSNGLKLDFTWLYGDLITASRLNAMVTAINTTIDEVILLADECENLKAKDTELNDIINELSDNINEKYEELIDLIGDIDVGDGSAIEIPDDWKKYSHIVKTDDGTPPENTNVVWLDLSNDDDETIPESEADLLWAYIENLESRLAYLEKAIESGIIAPKKPALLLESGGCLLLENGGRLLLE